MTTRFQRLGLELLGFVKSRPARDSRLEIALPTGGRLVAFGDYDGRKLATSGPWEPEVTAWIREYAAHAPNFVDVGANLGYHTVTQANNFASVFAFEPSAPTYDLLQQNIRQNELQNVRCWNSGLSDSEAMLRFVYLEEATGSSHFAIDDDLDGPLLPVLVFDHLVRSQPALQHRAVIKIDVEGWEQHVIRGMRDYIRTFRPIVLFEWNGLVKRPEDIDEVKSILGDDYVLFSVDSPRPQWALSKVGYVIYRVLQGYGRASRITTTGQFYYVAIAAIPSDLPLPRAVRPKRPRAIE